MAEHPNVELVRRGYDAFIAGDMEWMNEHLHENIVWHEPGGNFLSGDVRGREAVLAHFAKQVQHFLPEFDVHDVVANDDHAIALDKTNKSAQTKLTLVRELFAVAPSTTPPKAPVPKPAAAPKKK